MMRVELDQMHEIVLGSYATMNFGIDDVFRAEPDRRGHPGSAVKFSGIVNFCLYASQLVLWGRMQSFSVTSIIFMLRARIFCFYVSFFLFLAFYCGQNKRL